MIETVPELEVEGSGLESLPVDSADVSQLVEQIKKAILKAEKRGVSRYQLSKDSGVSQSIISRLMAGSMGLNITNLERLCKVLDIEVTVKPIRRKR